MLSAKNISHYIEDNVLLEAVNVNFEPGKLNLIIGPNGAGKSTLIKILCGQLKPSGGGEVCYNETNIAQLTNARLAQVRAVLSQNTELSFPLTVREVVMMGRYPHFTGKPANRDLQARDEAMQFFDVSDLADRNYLTLSGGEKQRVNFARVIAQIWYPTPGRYRYLILDEPLTFLDIRYQVEFMHKLSELLKHDDLIVVGVVHDLNLAARFAGHIVLLNHGRVLVAGDKKEVLTPLNIREAYQLTPRILHDGETMYLFFA